MVKVVPVSASDVTVSVPSCASTMRLLKGRPRPVPPVLKVTKGMKISSICSGGMPQPLS